VVAACRIIQAEPYVELALGRK